MSNNWVVIIFLLFMVLMMSLYLGSQDYGSFAFTKSGFSEYPYEGFATYQDNFYSREGYDKDESARDSSARDSSARDSSAPLSQPAAAAPTSTAYIMTPLAGHATPLHQFQGVHLYVQQRHSASYHTRRQCRGCL